MKRSLILAILAVCLFTMLSVYLLPHRDRPRSDTREQPAVTPEQVPRSPEVPKHPVTKVGSEILILDDTKTPELVAQSAAFLRTTFRLPVRSARSPYDLSFAHAPSRKQYDYHEILYTLRRYIHGRRGKVILLTDKDTFAPGLNWSTGCAFPNDNLLLVSTCRLDPLFWTGKPDPELHKQRIRKILLHELGHSFGLIAEHTDKTDCIMFDTDSIDDIDKVKATYTGDCLRHMRPFLKPGALTD